MPFADNSGLVSCLLQQFRKSLLVSVKLLGIVCKAVFMAMFTCQQAGPAWSADGIGYETVGKTGSIASYTVYVRGFNVTVIISTDGLV